jgi:hypothetical protein
MVGEDLNKPPLPKNIVLKINCEGLLLQNYGSASSNEDKDKLEIKLNGSRLSELSQYGGWLRICLKPNQLKLGRNQVTLRLLVGKLTVTALEIHVLH